MYSSLHHTATSVSLGAVAAASHHTLTCLLPHVQKIWAAVGVTDKISSVLQGLGQTFNSSQVTITALGVTAVDRSISGMVHLVGYVEQIWCEQGSRSAGLSPWVPFQLTLNGCCWPSPSTSVYTCLPMHPLIFPHPLRTSTSSANCACHTSPHLPTPTSPHLPLPSHVRSGPRSRRQDMHFPHLSNLPIPSHIHPAGPRPPRHIAPAIPPHTSPHRTSPHLPTPCPTITLPHPPRTSASSASSTHP